MKILVTGSSGLIGSETVKVFGRQGHMIYGVDNNFRQVFFGPDGDTSWNLEGLRKTIKDFEHHSIDIRDKNGLTPLFKDHAFDLIVHCAAQPSHDKAKDIPILDFEVNALGTINVLELMREYCPEASFIQMSTNKVYGDAPNLVPMKELPTRWEYADPKDYNGIAETLSIDQCTHSLFGASKLAADVMAQEYGRYFGLNICIFRAGCMTGPAHSAVELHGFLSYLVKVAVTGKSYTVFGYKGKQVRDNIESSDVIRAIECYVKNPRPGEVYNLGGGRGNSTSVVEAIEAIEQIAGKRIQHSYEDKNRIGDHICYISDLTKFRAHYPEWDIEVSLPRMLEAMVRSEHGKVAAR